MTAVVERAEVLLVDPSSPVQPARGVPGPQPPPSAPSPLSSPCRELDPELWFAESPSEVERAKALCRLCPLQQRCLAEALQRREPWGVWGGQLLAAGVVVAHKRGRGRPRKDAGQAVPTTGA